MALLEPHNLWQYARTVDIAAYLQHNGYTLEPDGTYDDTHVIIDSWLGMHIQKTGKRFRCPALDDLIIKGDMFEWPSRNLSSDALDFCVEVSDPPKDALQVAAELIMFRRSPDYKEISAMRVFHKHIGY